MLNRLFGKFSKDIGIDLGTANTLVYVKDKGIIINEPSVVAINTRIDQIVAVGDEAKNMLGKTPPHIFVSKPLTNGIISDYEVVEKMLRFFIDKVYDEGFNFASRTRVVISVPLEITEVEIKAVEDVLFASGAREVNVIQSSIAAAIGSRMPIEDPIGNMIVSIGAGSTEVSVISLSGIVVWKSSKIAGDEMNRNIMQYAREVFNLLVGESQAEQIKIKVGSVIETNEKIEFPLRGRDIITGLPREVMITDAHIREAISRSVQNIVDLIKTTLEMTPPELTADIHERGLLLTGGGSLLRGIDKLVADATEIPVRISDDPMSSVVRGSGHLLDNANLLKEVKLPSARNRKN
ncbi:MAG: rod shape-determining protein [Candidatus Magasanikbacteria bacterium RIFOXYC2_FULL_40_16]|uniref:Cell shape-determining protein MreB n=3 Tax=Candidatus Magasanikiibacteriota TaxID=1752731 RepID=A0A1F6NJL1_9BACT|nr:MAG: rod shape-determining protein [Candidatus Magasanikbacteria bacterium RIFOXYA2_FULL_40_20]OGH83864.1 MAG: rod shape-determining protein [Candidatus Magasanikbacteria bacterium RIFOXYB1_FULL_40_15]OGH86338.1 MAG: rod shape-determining protein [Candidatus Magasanikbacteria bacterium RIFOXYB2_FULL_40_13]OGH87135.1 MAG: rod shape-determining protein [Candidatus Magasanikbacteria bacterium RIFOXYA1_FULL_40_8]OGH89649.1 MAG: rod shape-determining protein [Candidatus Magasanikbacteria bacteriu